MHITDVERTWEFTHDGKTWTLPRPTLGAVEAPYFKRIRQQVVDGIEATYRAGSPQYRLQHDILQASFTNGTWKWNSKKFLDSFLDDDNLNYFVLLWFRQADPTVTPEMVQEFMQVLEPYEDEDGPGERSVVVRLVREMINDPNRSRPSLNTAATSPTTAKSSAS